MKTALANPVRDDSEIGHPLKNHTGEGITHIPERQGTTMTVCVSMNTETEGQIRQRNGDPTMPPWTP